MSREGERIKRALVDEDDDDADAVKDEKDDGAAASERTSVISSSLLISPELEYAKKSGGERKRVDLALFFALFLQYGV